MFFKSVFPTFPSLISKTLQLNVLGANLTKVNTAPNLVIVRYAARKGTRAKALAKKRALKLKKQSQQEPIPKFIVNRKVKVSPDLMRQRYTDENWLEVQPIDDVYNMKLYRGKPYSFAEAIQMHRDSHAAALLNDPSALIYANIELDLKLKKKDRFLESLNGIITFPNDIQFPKKNRIAVVCKELPEQVKATDAGAVYAGSTALIKQILSGSIMHEDFDYLICHPDMYKELGALRGILSRKYPTAHNGLLRLDIEQAVISFTNGIEYNLKKSSIEPDFGWVDVPFGRLNMSTEALEDNFKVVLNSVEKQKPPNTSHILFMIRTLLWCEKSRERFKVAHWEYLPNYPTNGVDSENKEDVEESDKTVGSSS